MSVYGYCPVAKCGAKGVTRTRGIPPRDRCSNGHVYLASTSLPVPNKLFKPANDLCFGCGEGPVMCDCAKPTHTEYVCGFMFEPLGGIVVMNLKNRPAWQAGKLNGVGGKMEPGESAGRAMAREFFEETGVLCAISDWHLFATLTGPDFKVNFFRTFSDDWHRVKTMESEEIVTVPIKRLGLHERVPNLDFLIPLALNRDGLDVVHFTRSKTDEAKAA